MLTVSIFYLLKRTFKYQNLFKFSFTLGSIILFIMILAVGKREEKIDKPIYKNISY